MFIDIHCGYRDQHCILTVFRLNEIFRYAHPVLRENIVNLRIRKELDDSSDD